MVEFIKWWWWGLPSEAREVIVTGAAFVSGLAFGCSIVLLHSIFYPYICCVEMPALAGLVMIYFAGNYAKYQREEDKS